MELLFANTYLNEERMINTLNKIITSSSWGGCHNGGLCRQRQTRIWL